MRIYTEEKIQKNNTTTPTTTISGTRIGHQNGYGNVSNTNSSNSNNNNNNNINININNHQSPMSPCSTSSICTSSNCSTTSSIESSSETPPPSRQGTVYELSNGASINRVNIPIVFNKNRPNISMYKFVKTKGKQATKECQNGAGTFRVSGSNQYFDNNNGDYVLKPPIYVTSNHNFYKKRISAFDKIQEEIKEMKLREDELRCQRIRGISYPNLNSICDEDFNSDDQTIESSEENKDSFHSRCSSNPDLLNGLQRDTLTIEIDPQSPTMDDSDECALRIGGPRRKIPLIAIWEQKIQEKSKIE